MAPTPMLDMPRLSATDTYRVSLEPAHNCLNSLVLLTRSDEKLGLDDWVYRAVEKMPIERRHRHRVIVEGLYHALQPVRSYPSFLSYVDDLAGTPPEVLRERWATGTRTLCAAKARSGAMQQPADVLANLESYLEFLEQAFESGGYDPEIEAEAFELSQRPERMHAMIVEHLRAVWDDVMSAEWARVRPMLQEAVEAYRRLPLNDLAPLDAVEKVIGQPLKESWHGIVSGAEQITFVPSAHIGPYLATFSSGAQRWIIFGARSPHGIERGLSALSSSELLVRINALSDSTRLRMLALLVEHDELCAQDLITKLDVSQPAASRHLRQLVANGYVTERWRDGSKCYQLNRARIADTIGALERFFQTT